MTALSTRERQAISAYARTGSRQAAAAELGVSPSTLHNFLTGTYRKLDVQGAIDAFRALGWLRVPDEEEEAVVRDIVRDTVEGLELRIERRRFHLVEDVHFVEGFGGPVSDEEAGLTARKRRP